MMRRLLLCVLAMVFAVSHGLGARGKRGKALPLLMAKPTGERGEDHRLVYQPTNFTTAAHVAALGFRRGDALPHHPITGKRTRTPFFVQLNSTGNQWPHRASVLLNPPFRMKEGERYLVCLSIRKIDVKDDHSIVRCSFTNGKDATAVLRIEPEGWVNAWYVFTAAGGQTKELEIAVNQGVWQICDAIIGTADDDDETGVREPKGTK